MRGISKLLWVAKGLTKVFPKEKVTEDKIPLFLKEALGPYTLDEMSNTIVFAIRCHRAGLYVRDKVISTKNRVLTNLTFW